MIREQWVTPTYVPKNYKECCTIITDYFQYFNKAWLGTKMPDDMAFGHARMLIDSGDGGYVQQVKNALAGRDGGLIKIIDAITEQLIKQETEKYVLFVLSKVNPSDYDLKLSMIKMYLKEYAHVLPGEKLISPYELAAGNSFDAFIRFHLEWINSFRKAVI